MLTGPGTDCAPELGAGADTAPPEMFGTETMAELYARQGRLAEAIAVYRRLLGAGPSAERRARLLSRLETLDRARVGAAAGGLFEAELPRPPAPVTQPAGILKQSPGPTDRVVEPVAGQPTAPPRLHRLPLVVHEPVRSGQVIYAEKNDLIVLAPVNPGAELVADGNIHIYATMRGRAFAGAEGCSEARVFCQRLEAELVAINDAYLLYDDIPLDRRGRPGQVLVRDGRCIVLPFG
jgi:septum site-determining protein MinC